MTPGDSEITVERLGEIIELTLELAEEIPEEIGLVVQELVEEVVWLQLRVADLVSRKKVRRLMRLMGLEAIYRRPNTSEPVPGHRIYPYLLQGVEVNRVDQVWAADITYIPMAQGFLYLVAIMDWHSRQVLAWKLSNTMDTGFCVAALEEALNRGRPEIFNSDQGAQFTSEAFTQMFCSCCRGRVALPGKLSPFSPAAGRDRSLLSGDKGCLGCDSPLS